MDKMENKKRPYVYPCIAVIKTETDNMLVNTSTMNGGHNQGHVGGGGGDAKRAWFDEDDFEEETENSEASTTYNPWDE
ncbi:hypothetical protein [Segatella maculosa]|uniref:hypothetical protein n=1 Tax=Segatella maculosa TaxID=439703 RepID=UPI0003704702|nr:hypothetical protein [Segatella maculosa]